MIRFVLQAGDGAARAGQVVTPRGPFRTPAFMPVGTHATVKAMTPEEVAAAGAEIVLANTYHLHLRPGEEIIRDLGGLHRFMHWGGPILTDSGGYQIFSLKPLAKVGEEGAAFRSHLDGTALFITPEKAVAIQRALGSDIMMCLDWLRALPAQEAELEAAVALTSRWAARCRAANGGGEGLFAIVQGGTSEALRRRSAEELGAMEFDGYALGGLGVGEPPEAMHETVAFAAPLLPADRPRYQMGTGEPRDLLAAIGAGVDMFDCVLPTRNARNGTLYTRAGKLSIKQARFRDDGRPLDEACACPACRDYSRAYLRHLFMGREILSMRLNSYHNLFFFLELMREAREAIAAGTFAAFARDFLERFERGDDASTGEAEDG